MGNYTPAPADSRGHPDFALFVGASISRTLPLELPTPRLGFAAAPARGGGCTRGTAHLRGLGRAADEIDQPRQRIVAVALAGAEALGSDDDHAFPIEPAAREASQPLPRIRIER